MSIEMIFTYLERLLVVTAPIIAAILLYKSTKQAKADKAYKELRDTLEQERETRQLENESRRDKEFVNRESQRDNAIASLSDKITKLDDRVESINERIDGLEEKIDIEKLNVSLGKLIEISEVTFEYSQSLAGVVTTMAGSLEKLSPNESVKIEQVLEKHGNAEREIVNKLHKMIY